MAGASVSGSTDRAMRALSERVPRVARPGLRRIWHNFPQKVGALVAALVLWLAANGDTAAVVERTLDVNLVARGLGAEQRVFDVPPQVRVTLSGTRARLESLSASLVEATVDVEGLGDGNFELPVTVTPPADTRVARVAPEEVSGRIDGVVSGLLEVRVAVLGAPADSVVRVTPVPASVVATGPRSRLSQAKYALALAPAAGDDTARLAPVDASGTVVEGVALKPDTVRLERTQMALTVQKAVNLELAPLPAGLTLGSVVFRPARPRVVGPPAAIASIELVRATPLVPLVPGAQTVAVRLDGLPPGVRPADTVVATITVAAAGQKPN